MTELTILEMKFKNLHDNAVKIKSLYKIKEKEDSTARIGGFLFTIVFSTMLYINSVYSTSPNVKTSFFILSLFVLVIGMFFSWRNLNKPSYVKEEKKKYIKEDYSQLYSDLSRMYSLKIKEYTKEKQEALSERLGYELTNLENDKEEKDFQVSLHELEDTIVPKSREETIYFELMTIYMNKYFHIISK